MESGESKPAKRAKPRATKEVGKATFKKRSAAETEPKNPKSKQKKPGGKGAIEFTASAMSSSSGTATISVGAGAERFNEVVDRLKLEVQPEPLLLALRVAHGIHDLRSKLDATYKRTGLTRTSVLLGIVHAESRVGHTLSDCGMKLGALLLDAGLGSSRARLALGEDYQLGDDTDFLVHPNVIRAIESFASTWPGVSFTVVGLAWGLLSAREGSFYRRIRQAKLNVDEATRRLEKMLEDMASAVGAPRMAGIVADRAEGRDSLSLARDYHAMASVISSSEPIAPLAIGIFGHWGSGKSFFMDKVQEEVSRRAKRVQEEREAAKKRKESEPKLPFVGEVVHVRFNAWHYMDSNLWPNLVVNIFDGLAKHISPDDMDAGREALFSRVGTAQLDLKFAHRRVDDLKQQEEQAKAAHDALKGQHETAPSDWSKSALVLTQQLGRELGKAKGGLFARGLDRALDAERKAVSTSEVAAEVAAVFTAGKQTLEELSGVRNAARAFWGGKVPGVPPWVWILAGVCVAAGWLSYPDMVAKFEWLQGETLKLWGPVSTFLGTVAAAFYQVKGYAHRVRSLVQQADVTRKEMGAQMPERLSELRRERGEAQQRVQQAQEALHQAQAKLNDLRSGKQLQRFLQERSQSDDYRKSLGMIAQVRADFERLEDILDGAYSEPTVQGAGGTAAPSPVGRVERIVLYIDDLDRCPSGRVLEVIQAVHLLLATKLFVVLVAIDPRWLKKAFSGGADKSGHWLRLDGDGVCAEDYLEKIFQVPYALPPMGNEGFGNLIAHLTGAKQPADVAELAQLGSDVSATVKPDGAEERPANRSLEASESGQSFAQTEAVVGGSGLAKSGGSIVEGSPPDDLLTTAPAELTGPERVYLARFGPPLVRTPRATKRLVNSYRFVRATLDHRQLADFLRIGEDGAQFMAVIALLALTVGRAKDAGLILATVEGVTTGALRDVLADDEVYGGFVAALQPLLPGSELLEAAVPRVRRYSFAIAVEESEAANLTAVRGVDRSPPEED